MTTSEQRVAHGKRLIQTLVTDDDFEMHLLGHPVDGLEKVRRDIEETEEPERFDGMS